MGCGREEEKSMKTRLMEQRICALHAYIHWNITPWPMILKEVLAENGKNTVGLPPARAYYVQKKSVKMVRVTITAATYHETSYEAGLHGARRWSKRKRRRAFKFNTHQLHQQCVCLPNLHMPDTSLAVITDDAELWLLAIALV
jgi:hypothetical protein